jgi:hypothetical protein
LIGCSSPADDELAPEPIDNTAMARAITAKQNDFTRVACLIIVIVPLYVVTNAIAARPPGSPYCAL